LGHGNKTINPGIAGAKGELLTAWPGGKPINQIYLVIILDFYLFICYSRAYPDQEKLAPGRLVSCSERE
jgi:hypothetical protein